MKIYDLTANEKRFIQYFINHSKNNDLLINSFSFNCDDIISDLSITQDEFQDITTKFKSYEIINLSESMGNFCKIKMNYSVFLIVQSLYDEHNIKKVLPTVLNYLRDFVKEKIAFVRVEELKNICNLTNEQTNIILYYLEEHNIFKQSTKRSEQYLYDEFLADDVALYKLQNGI